MSSNFGENSPALKVSKIKELVLLIRIFFTTLFIFITACKVKKSEPRIFYGGAKSGSVGGPLVKVKRLKEYFPQKFFNYNIVYALSNSPRLSTEALSYLKQKKIPLILNQNGVFYPGWYGDGWKRMNAQMALAYHAAEYVFWQSKFCKRAADLFLGERKGPGEILFNAVDTSIFTPAHLDSQDSFYFLVTGKITRHLSYRLESTIAGLAKARLLGMDAHLIISGWVEDKVELLSMVNKYDLDKFVKITGPYTQDEAPLIYQIAQAYITMKYLDPCPNAVIEALACGLPVLYSASGGVPELVGSDAGIGLQVLEDWERVQVPSADQIAAGMSQIIRRYAEMSRAARARAIKYFSIEHWIKRHKEIYNSCLGLEK